MTITEKGKLNPASNEQPNQKGVAAPTATPKSEAKDESPSRIPFL